MADWNPGLHPLLWVLNRTMASWRAECQDAGATLWDRGEYSAAAKELPGWKLVGAAHADWVEAGRPYGRG